MSDWPWRPPMLGGAPLVPLGIKWRDGTAFVSGGILGDMSPAALEALKAEREQREAEEAYKYELRTLHENVILLDDWRLNNGCEIDPKVE
jgi:hypothetical protein